MEDFSSYLKLINSCDSDEPLLSETALGKCLENIPLFQVSQSDLTGPIQALNLEQLIPTEDGLARDYRGLAERMGFSSIEVETRFKRSYNPAKSLIDAFINGNLKNRKGTKNDNEISLNDLIKMIERIERFDVIDDFLPTLVRLASNTTKQLIAPRISIQNQHQIEPANVRDFDRLTIDDTVDSAIIYDAFICYAPEDFPHAQELISLLEESNIRVATADDLLPGHFEHDSLIRLIDLRCRKVVIILTPNFTKSKECEFQTKFASEIGIRERSPKIIPVLYEACNESLMPSIIKVLSKIDMTSRATRQWQYKKLIRSLEVEQQEVNTNPVINRKAFSSIGAVSYSDREPIVDLLQSQDSTCAILNETLRPEEMKFVQTTTVRSASPLTSSSSNLSSNGTSSWLRNAKKFSRQWLGNPTSIDYSSPTPSTSSQAMLIRPNSPDIPDEGEPEPHHRF